jgi:hypothetical protein
VGSSPATIAPMKGRPTAAVSSKASGMVPYD